jgi:MFS family permease
LLSLPAGALVDRWNRKGVMIACDVVRAVCFLSLPVTWFFGHLGLLQLYFISVVAGSAFVFYNIAEISSLPRIVDRELLTRATSVNTVVEWTGENAGPALGGALVGLGRSTVAGAMVAYAVQAAMLLASVLFLGAIRRPMRAERTAGTRHLIAEIREGAGWVFAHSTLRLMTLLGLGTSFVFSPIFLALIVRARGDFHASPFSIGLMFSLGGTAGLLATLVAPWIQSRLRVGVVLVAAAFTWALGLVLVALANSMTALMFAWLIVPAVAGVQEVVVLSYRLALIPDAMQGRVNSVIRFVVWGVRPAALALGGYMIAQLSAEFVLWLSAAGMALVALGSIPLRGLR